MAMICGLATTTAATAAAAASPRCASERCRTSQSTSTASATSAAMTADSWLTSAPAPMTTPSTMAVSSRGRRRSRMAASSASGRNSAPAAILMWYQSWYSSIVARPYRAPAVIAPSWVDSHSRAAR